MSGDRISQADRGDERVPVEGANDVGRPGQVELRSVITCPLCGHRQTETMPTDACQFFYDCSACGALLKPKAGDCCVYCSYGSVPCPPVQEARRTGDAAPCCDA